MKKYIDSLSSADEIREIRKTKGLKSSISNDLLGIMNLDITKEIIKGINKFATSSSTSTKVFIPSDMCKDIKKISSNEGISTLKENDKGSILHMIEEHLTKKGFKVTYLKSQVNSRDYGGGRDYYTNWYIVVSI